MAQGIGQGCATKAIDWIDIDTCDFNEEFHGVQATCRCGKVNRRLLLAEDWDLEVFETEGVIQFQSDYEGFKEIG